MLYTAVLCCIRLFLLHHAGLELEAQGDMCCTFVGDESRILWLCLRVMHKTSQVACLASVRSPFMAEAGRLNSGQKQGHGLLLLMM